MVLGVYELRDYIYIYTYVLIKNVYWTCVRGYMKFSRNVMIIIDYTIFRILHQQCVITNPLFLFFFLDIYKSRLR